MDRSVSDIYMTVRTLQAQGFLKALLQVAKFPLAFDQAPTFVQNVIGHQFNED
jgi:hypothetical protein